MSEALNPVDSESLAAKSHAANAALERRVAESNRIMAAKQEEMMRKTAAIQAGTTPVPGDANKDGDRWPGMRGKARREARASDFYNKVYDGKKQRAPNPPPPPGITLRPNKFSGKPGKGAGRRN